MLQAQRSCDSLLKQCSAPAHPNVLETQYEPKRKPYLLKARNILHRNIAPEDMEENKRLIEKIRKRFHKKSKEQSIKKTELCEDHHIFTA